MLATKQNKTITELTDTQKHWLAEHKKCSNPVWGWLYFIITYVKILSIDETTGRKAWVAFELWDAQVRALLNVHNNSKSIALKSRQVGISWALLAYGLWIVLFRPDSKVAYWSYRDDEAKEATDRLLGMFERLPKAFQLDLLTDSVHKLKFSNGSTFRVFNPASGDAENNDLAIVDECELIPNLRRLMNRVNPTVQDSGKLVLISRIDKDQADTYFRRVWKNSTVYARIFIAWFERPDRDQDWYDATVNEMLEIEKEGLDAVYSSYPATPEQALAPATANRAIPHNWLAKVYQFMEPMQWGISDEMDRQLKQNQTPAINGLEVFHFPQPGRSYAIGIDGAEGNPNSDDSSINIVDCTNPLKKIQVARLTGLYTPHVTAYYANELSLWYNDASILPERNNHGHSIIETLENLSAKVVNGLDDSLGWLSNKTGKTIMYDDGTEDIRLLQTVIHSETTYNQVSSIEGATLRAPSGMKDDDADSFMLALKAVDMLNNNQWYTVNRKNEKGKKDLVRQRLKKRGR